MKRLLLAIDPGPERSGWVAVEHDGEMMQLLACGWSENYSVLELIEHAWKQDPGGAELDLAVEMIASYGMAVGASVFETCVWIGRFQQAWFTEANGRKTRVSQIPRKDIKLHVCGLMRAKDSNIRQALLDKLGPIGTKANPGPLYGMKTTHMWAALAVAVTALETCQSNNNNTK